MLRLFEAHREAQAAEKIYFDLATLCEQARIPLEETRAAAARLAAKTTA